MKREQERYIRRFLNRDTLAALFVTLRRIDLDGEDGYAINVASYVAERLYDAGY